MKPITPVLALLLYFGFLYWLNDYQFQWWREGESDRIMIVMPAVLALLMGIFPLGAGIAIAEYFGGKMEAEMDRKPSEAANLVSLRSVDGISGSFSGGFFLGVGSIGSDMYYFYYEKAGKDRYQPKKHLAGDGTYVYEEDFSQRPDGPYVEHFDWHFKRRWLQWFFLEPWGQTTYFHVPKDSILRGYKLQ